MAQPKMVIGVDFGGEKLEAAAVAERGGKGKVLPEKPRRLTRGEKRTGRQVARDIVAMARQVRAQHRDVAAVGIGSPGIIDVASGDYRFPPCNVPHWEDDGPVSLKRAVEDALGLPCFVNNDAQVFAAGEQRWGDPQARGSRCMLFLTLGTGIGGALRVKGEDFWGARNTIEIGHACIDFTDTARPCGCGLYGCAEAYASNTAISAEALRYIRCGRLDRPADGKVDAKWVYGLAKAGHPAALRIIGRAHEALAMLIANFANTLSIDVCVIGGGIAEAGAFLFDDVRRRVAAHRVPTADVDIRPASLKRDFAVLGAGAFALEMLDGQE